MHIDETMDTYDDVLTIKKILLNTLAQPNKKLEFEASFPSTTKST